MYFPDDLLDFIRAHRDELTLSVYVEAAPADPAARRNWRVRLRQGLADIRDSLANAPADEQDAFERCAADVLARLPNGDTPPSTHGWACFATAGGDALALHLPESAETTVTWGLGVRVVPYLKVATADHALVVRIDRQHARIARWHDGTLEPIAELEADAPRDIGPHMGDAPRQGFHEGTRGPTGTDEEQRQRQSASDKLLAAARNRVVHLRAHNEPVLIGGADEAMRQLAAVLPHHLAGAMRLVPELDMRLADGPAAPVIQQALVDLDAVRRAQRVTELRELAHVRGRAAMGYEPTRAAADVGAIAELIFSEQAWRQHPEQIEDLVQRALMEGASVAVAPPLPDAPLDGEADGIIAGLRFPIPVPR